MKEKKKTVNMTDSHAQMNTHYALVEFIRSFVCQTISTVFFFLVLLGIESPINRIIQSFYCIDRP